MKIPDKNHIVNLNAYIRNVDNGGKAGSQTQKPEKQASSGEEKVELSAKARDIQKIKKALDNVPDIRGEKVAQLKRSIEEGTYNVKAENVARKMLKENLLDEIL